MDESIDHNSTRKRKRNSKKLLRRRLKTGAVLSVFINLPSHYTYQSEPHRSGLSTTSSRHERAAARLAERCENFFNADKASNLDDIIAKLSEELQKQKYLLHRTDKGLYLIHLSDQQPPSIVATIFINADLEVTFYQEQLIIPSSSYKHILSANKVALFSQVLNLMVFAKNKQPQSKTEVQQFQTNLRRLINDFILTTENEQQILFLKFFAEQIDLVFTSKHQRRYSAELLMMTYIIFATSPRAYERLMEEQLLMLPSSKTLKKITMNLDSKTGLDDVQYLRFWYSQLNAFDRNVIIMIDEIYLSKRIEASAGQVLGLTDNCQIASTALCFMIKSLSSSYQDMVGIYPVLSNIEQAVQARNSVDHEATSKAELLYCDMQFNILPTENDVGIIYYVTGHCCRSLVRSNKCEKCKEATIACVNDSLEDRIPETFHKFFNEINRGGLWKPTPDLFSLGCLCWQIFAELSRENLWQRFLEADNQRDVFREIYNCIL